MEAWNGRALFGALPESSIELDAYTYGWGAHYEGVVAGGLWTQDEQRWHINTLELLAGSFTVRCFAKDRINVCIRLHLDNISAVWYAFGGIRSSVLACLASNFWAFCLERNILVQAEYLLGLHNVEADWHSRHLSDGRDWRLDPAVFSALSTLWGPFQVDLFASRTNAQLLRCFSWHPDPGPERVDTFLQTWG